MEKRKIEIKWDGSISHASENDEKENLILAWEPLPDLSEMKNQDEFYPFEISAEEFERVWNKVTKK